MNKIEHPEISLNLGKYSAGDRILISNEFMKYEQFIAELEAEHKKELAEKDKMITYALKTAEKATERKRAAIREAEHSAKVNFSWAALIIAAMCVIPYLFWFLDFAAKNFWLWANGR